MLLIVLFPYSHHISSRILQLSCNNLSRSIKGHLRVSSMDSTVITITVTIHDTMSFHASALSNKSFRNRQPRCTKLTAFPRTDANCLIIITIQQVLAVAMPNCSQEVTKTPTEVVPVNRHIIRCSTIATTSPDPASSCSHSFPTAILHLHITFNNSHRDSNTKTYCPKYRTQSDRAKLIKPQSTNGSRKLRAW